MIREPEQVVEMVYVEHPDLDGGTWVPRSSLRQLGSQGWIETEPPPPPKAVAPIDEPERPTDDDDAPASLDDDATEE